MLEKLPDLVGHALRGQRAGLDKTAFQAVDLRGGMAALAVSSLAFADHGPIPERYTADGEGVSPPLQWGGVPAAAASLLLIVEDADSPTPQPLVHAIVVGLPAGDGALPEAALPSRENDGAGLQVGRNSYLQASWLPPDPPPGHGVHRYAFQVFALEAGADFDGEPGREAVLEAIRDHGLASGCLIGTYERPDTSISVSDEEGVPAVLPGTLAT
jgi:Raf kinase inhibitor-like YbhB/YbcL family protein